MLTRCSFLVKEIYQCPATVNDDLEVNCLTSTLQEYMEKMDAIDQEGATGKMGHHTVERLNSGTEKINLIFDKALKF